MKKRLAKILTVVAAFAFMISVFALAGCTDDKDEPRTLDGIELYIVGEWGDDYDVTVTFKSDGTYKWSTNHRGEFWHKGDGYYDGRHYQIIRFNNADTAGYALFDDDSDHLYYFDSTSAINPQHPSLTRIQ